jgi:hypothetical protein
MDWMTWCYVEMIAVPLKWLYNLNALYASGIFGTSGTIAKESDAGNQ